MTVTLYLFVGVDLLTVIFSAEVPVANWLTGIIVALREAVTPGDDTVAVRLTFPVREPRDPIRIVVEPDVPVPITNPEGDAEMVKSTTLICSMTECVSD